jgi:hypothetical protein
MAYRATVSVNSRLPDRIDTRRCHIIRSTVLQRGSVTRHPSATSVPLEDALSVFVATVCRRTLSRASTVAATANVTSLGLTALRMSRSGS